MSEQMRNVEPHARLSGNNIIYPISMNREDYFITRQTGMWFNVSHLLTHTFTIYYIIFFHLNAPSAY